MERIIPRKSHNLANAKFFIEFFNRSQNGFRMSRSGNLLLEEDPVRSALHALTSANRNLGFLWDEVKILP